MDRYPDGKMTSEDFIDTFKIAFPERPEEKILKLAANMSNQDGKICKSFSKQIQSKISKLFCSYGKYADFVLHVLWRKIRGQFSWDF